MDESIAILGRQPALGFAELEALYGSENIEMLNTKVARVHLSPCYIDFSRLGGTVKLCKTLKILDTTSWREVEEFLTIASPSFTERMSKGKMHLGLSSYGLELTPQQLSATGLRIKKAITKKLDRSVRVVPNNSLELSTAQVIHNKLLTEHGWELVFIQYDQQTIIAQTLLIQDIESYGLRDFGRPKRDARVGMLPPKLAKILINLATGPDEFTTFKPKLNSYNCLEPEDKQKIDSFRSKITILDPFCGTGVIPQEALLMGYKTQGTDLDSRMVDYTKENLEWLIEHFKPMSTIYNLAVGDATNYQWRLSFDAIASETYLGRPFTSLPPQEILERTISDCDLIIKKFLKNIFPQLKTGVRLCLAVPAWQVKPGQFRHLSLVDQLSNLGYNRLRFKHSRNEDLLYCRTNQIVGRELLVLTRD